MTEANKGQHYHTNDSLLVDSNQQDSNTDQLNNELKRSLKEATDRAIQLSQDQDQILKASWIRASEIVSEFKPVPWFIWRIANHVLGRTGHVNQVSEGHLLGLRRLMFAAASDTVLGSGKKVNNMRSATEILPSDIITAVSVIHACARKLTAKSELQRVWRPILDDAILRAEIGYYVGSKRPPFGRGRGMLAGFAGRIGLAILISQGDNEQARQALEKLAVGEKVATVGLEVYKCDPLQISAMTLSASGCGRDAAFGTISYASPKGAQLTENEQQGYWHAAFCVAEALRVGSHEELSLDLWESLGYYEKSEREQLIERTLNILKHGSSWPWIV